MSLDNTYRAYGRYLVIWNSLQPVLDAAIVREAGMAPVHGAILVGTLNAKSRLTVLRGLLANAGGEKADIVPLLAEIAQEGKKQAMVQGHPIASNATSLLFTRPDVAGRLAASSVSYTAEEMDALADDLDEKIDALTEALAVTPADIAALKAAAEETIGKRRRDVDSSDD